MCILVQYMYKYACTVRPRWSVILARKEAKPSRIASYPSTLRLHTALPHSPACNITTIRAVYGRPLNAVRSRSLMVTSHVRMASRRFLLRHPLQSKSPLALSFSLTLGLEDLALHSLAVIASCQEHDNINSPHHCNIIIRQIWVTILVTGSVRLMTSTLNLIAFQQV